MDLSKGQLFKFYFDKIQLKWQFLSKSVAVTDPIMQYISYINCGIWWNTKEKLQIAEWMSKVSHTLFHIAEVHLNSVLNAINVPLNDEFENG